MTRVFHSTRPADATREVQYADLAHHVIGGPLKVIPQETDQHQQAYHSDETQIHAA